MNKLRLWRLERCLSQYDLSHLSGVPRYIIQLAESGLTFLTESQSKAISKALGVDEKYLKSEIEHEK